MTTHITIAAPRPAPSFTPLFVAIDRFLPEEGIEASVEYTTDVGRVRSGEVDYTATAVGRGGILEPRGVKFICQHATRATGHTLMIRPDIGTADRISSVVMIGNVSEGSSDSGLDRELTSILKQHGVTLNEADISLVRIEGGHPQQYEALQEGIGDGAPVGAPWWIHLARQGYKSLGCEADYAPGMGCNGVHTTAKKIEEDPAQVAAFVRSYVRAVRYCRENVPGTLETMLKWADVWGVDSMEMAEEVYKVVSPYWNPEIDPAVLERLLKNTSEKLNKPLQPLESVADLRFYHEAMAAG